MSKADPQSGVGVNLVQENYAPCYTTGCGWYNLKKNRCDRIEVIKQETQNNKPRG